MKKKLIIIPPEIKLKIANHYKAGVTTREIRRRFEIGSGQLGEILDEFNVPRRKPVAD